MYCFYEYISSDRKLIDGLLDRLLHHYTAPIVVSIGNQNLLPYNFTHPSSFVL